MGILLWIVLGAVAGSVSRFVMPGPSAGGMPVAVGVGIGGALIGGLVGTLTGGTMTVGSVTGIDIRNLLMAIIASMVVLFIYRAYAMRAMA